MSNLQVVWLIGCWLVLSSQAQCTNLRTQPPKLILEGYQQRYFQTIYYRYITPPVERCCPQERKTMFFQIGCSRFRTGDLGLQLHQIIVDWALSHHNWFWKDTTRGTSRLYIIVTLRNRRKLKKEIKWTLWMVWRVAEAPWWCCKGLCAVPAWRSAGYKI